MLRLWLVVYIVSWWEILSWSGRSLLLLLLMLYIAVALKVYLADNFSFAWMIDSSWNYVVNIMEKRKLGSFSSPHFSHPNKWNFSLSWVKNHIHIARIFCRTKQQHNRSRQENHTKSVLVCCSWLKSQLKHGEEKTIWTFFFNVRIRISSTVVSVNQIKKYLSYPLEWPCQMYFFVFCSWKSWFI